MGLGLPVLLDHYIQPLLLIKLNPMKTFIEIVRNCMIESVKQDKEELCKAVQKVMDKLELYPSGIDLLNDVFK